MIDRKGMLYNTEPGFAELMRAEFAGWTGPTLPAELVRPLAGIDRLSPREISAARSFASGKTYKEIAQALGVAPATVRNQLQSAYAKLGVGSKIELARQLNEPE
mgnify:CR=1 FL=1